MSSISRPILISHIAGRFLIFDVTAIAELRKSHNICGVLLGCIPQVPQQNVFLGIPIEILPEEARLLVLKDIAVLVDEGRCHRDLFKASAPAYRRRVLELLYFQGEKAQELAKKYSQKKAEVGKAKFVVQRASTERARSTQRNHAEVEPFNHVVEESEPLLEQSLDTYHYAITPTMSDGAVSIQEMSSFLPHHVPASYSLFSHLHARGYFITPGLRFGCDYTVYPGDPLRYHSHFLAVGYHWEDDIQLIDIIGGGRLGTGVKKGFLIGGENIEMSATDRHAPATRVFCIEWGGM